MGREKKRKEKVRKKRLRKACKTRLNIKEERRKKRRGGEQHGKEGKDMGNGV